MFGLGWAGKDKNRILDKSHPMSLDKLELETRRLSEAMLGKALTRLNSPSELAEALSQGEVHLIFEEHQWVGNEVRDGRVHFFNPAAANLEPGQELPADNLPARRAEDTGIESAPLEVLTSWLDDGRMRALTAETMK